MTWEERFDEEFGFDQYGGKSPVRQDKLKSFIQSAIDKAREEGKRSCDESVEEALKIMNETYNSQRKLDREEERLRILKLIEGEIETLGMDDIERATLESLKNKLKEDV